MKTTSVLVRKNCQRVHLQNATERAGSVSAVRNVLWLCARCDIVARVLGSALGNHPLRQLERSGGPLRSDPWPVPPWRILPWLIRPWPQPPGARGVRRSFTPRIRPICKRPTTIRSPSIVSPRLTAGHNNTRPAVKISSCQVLLQAGRLQHKGSVPVRSQILAMPGHPICAAGTAAAPTNLSM